MEGERGHGLGVATGINGADVGDSLQRIKVSDLHSPGSRNLLPNSAVTRKGSLRCDTAGL